MTGIQQPAPGEFFLYETEVDRARVECRFEEDMPWLTQAGMDDLFQTTKQNIAKHLKAIFAEGGLLQEAVVNPWLTTAADGKRRRVRDLKLAAIVAVGYCVRSTCDRRKNQKDQHVGWPFLVIEMVGGGQPHKRMKTAWLRSLLFDSQPSYRQTYRQARSLHVGLPRPPMVSATRQPRHPCARSRQRRHWRRSVPGPTCEHQGAARS